MSKATKSLLIIIAITVAAILLLSIPLLSMSYTGRPKYSFTIEESKLAYDGSPIVLNGYLEDKSLATEYGVMVFIDGVMQSYHTDLDGTARVMHVFALDKGEQLDFQIVVDPVNGRSGETLYLQVVLITTLDKYTVVNMLPPDFELTGSQDGFIRANGNISGDFWLSKTIDISYQADSVMAVVPQDYGRLVDQGAWPDSDSVTLDFSELRELRMAGFIDASKTTDEYPPVGDTLPLTVTASPFQERDYRVYVFCNLVPQDFPDGTSYTNLFYREGQRFSEEIVLDLSAFQSGEVVVITIVAIPLIDSSVPEDDLWRIDLWQSPTYVMVKE